MQLDLSVLLTGCNYIRHEILIIFLFVINSLSKRVEICIYPGNRALSEVLIIIQLVKKFPTFTDPEFSLPCAQKLSTGSHSVTDEANQYFHTLFL